MGKLLLIFDGFDEMAAKVDRQQMINNFWELAKVVVPGAKVVLTCRTEHFLDAKEGRALLNAELQASTKQLTGETPQFEVLELEKFNDEQIWVVLSHQMETATVERGRWGINFRRYLTVSWCDVYDGLFGVALMMVVVMIQVLGTVEDKSGIV